MQYRHRHLQIAHHLFHCCRRGRRLLTLGFEKQFRFGENALTSRARAFAPGCVQLPGLARVATVSDESRCHQLALFRIHTRHRDQILHGHLRRDLACAHLLLNAFRQQLHQCQPARHPTRAAVEAATQLVEGIAETPLHLRQQPALFQRAFRRPQAQRPREQHRFGFTHRPHGSFHRVPAELFERGDALVAIDHQIPLEILWQNDHDDGSLLADVGE